MWNTIKKSIKQHYIIWWIGSCFTVILSGVAYLAVKIKQKHEDALENLILWLVIWAYITCMGIFVGAIRWLADVTDKCTLDDNDGSKDAEENADFNVDENGKVDTVVIHREDGSVTEFEQFV